jgi:SSS family solute:Na+ symporter
MVIPAMLARYLPPGMLGLGFTALMASFMSGMAGNVTAFNTVWTYDIYQTHFAPGRPDAHYLRMGRLATVFGVIVSVGAAYLAAQFNNIMNLLQLVFAFVNAPLFATFLLGMFWRRANGHGSFAGLVMGTAAAALHHGLTLPAGEAAGGLKGGWLGIAHIYPSEMAQNFWTAIVAWSACLTGTIVVSLATRQGRPDSELRGLVYSLTPRPEDRESAWYLRPVVIGLVVLAATLALNLVFA